MAKPITRLTRFTGGFDAAIGVANHSGNYTLSVRITTTPIATATITRIATNGLTSS
jgi:hypothetical protein